MASLMDVFVSVRPNTAKFEPEMKKQLRKIDAASAGKQAGKSFGSGFGTSIKSLGGVLAGAFAGIQVAGFFKDAVSGASDLGETTSKVSQIFGPASKDIQAFAANAATALGQTRQQALDANATFGIFGKSAGLAGGKLSGFTTEMTTLASDLASFNNTSPEEAIEAIGSALRGEAEPMRKYGVLLDDASMRQQALKMGLISTTKEALTPQQKVLAAQALIMEQTKTAQGDFARTSGGLANQQRILSARFNDVKSSLGEVFLPLVTKAVTFLAGPGVAAFTQFKNGLTGNVEIMDMSARPALEKLGMGIGALVAAFKDGDVTSDGFIGAMERIGSTGRIVFDEIRAAVTAFTAAWTYNDGEVTSSGLPGFMERVGYAARQTFDVFKSEVLPRLAQFAAFLRTEVVPRLADLAGWINRNREVVGTFIGVIGAAIAIVKTVTLVTKIWAGVQAALNVVLAANPIGIIILAIAALAAGVVYAYQESDTFRAYVNEMWRELQVAGTWLKDLWGKLQEAAKWVQDLGEKVAVWVIAKFIDARNKVNDFIQKIKDFTLPAWVQKLADLVGGIADKMKSGAGKVASFFGVGDAPASFRGTAIGGGKALARVQSVLPPGLAVTSTYRSPAHNARIPGASRTSLHMDKNNPAVDIGGPTHLLDQFAAQLAAMGGWRQLLWRVPNHFDHIHVAHNGGVVDASWPKMPGWRSDERPVRAQVGETILPRGASAGGVQVTYTGDFYAYDPTDLVREQQKRTRDAMAAYGVGGLA